MTECVKRFPAPARTKRRRLRRIQNDLVVGHLCPVEHEADKLLLFEGAELLIDPVEVEESGTDGVCVHAGGLQVAER